MDKAEHGKRLRAAMGAARVDRRDVSEATGRGVRTVTNWTNGVTMPDGAELAALRKLFPGYDDPGDPVEVSVMNSELTEDRRYALLATYKRLLREQSEGDRTTA